MANQNDNENRPDSNEDDNFGLPDIEYKPLQNAEEPANEQTESFEGNEPETEEPSYSYKPTIDDEEPKSNTSIIVGSIIAIILIAGAFLYYQYVYKPNAEKEKKELLAKQAAEKKKEEEARLAKEREEAERRRLEQEQAAANAKPVEGTIETLTGRTGRYYVVVSTAIDVDLLTDYARKQLAEGKNFKIIPPFGKTKFYRLTIADFDTFADAQANADSMKATYGDALWVVKY